MRCLNGLDPKHEIPLQSLIPSLQRRPRPYIYSEEEIRRIVEAAGELPSINGIRALTCSTLFGLIAVTSLRVSEAVSLDVDNVDLEAGVLTIRHGKLGKARLQSLAESTTTRLVVLQTGLRSSELINLRRGDVINHRHRGSHPL
ncbi:MAG: tyrosine-type recombinase/integrase [Methylococcales bacterium]